jgi:hypothetical protein
MRSSRLRLFASLALLFPGCADPEDREDSNTTQGGIDVPEPVDPPQADPGDYLEGIDGEFHAAADEFDVPVQILQAVGYAETQWQMVEGDEEFEGWAPASGTMALRGDHITRGAELLGLDVDAVKQSRATNIRAAAAILDDLATTQDIDRADLGAWAPAIAELAGVADHNASIGYIHNDVFGLIKNGLVVTDLAGNVISEIEPEPDVTPNYDPPGGPTFATMPDYVGAIYRNSPNQGTRPAGATGKVRMVIIHTCEGAYSGCWGWLVNSQSGVSAHYVVKEDGSEISQLVKEAKRGFHIAAKYDKNLNGGKETDLQGVSSNNFTVGIEHAGFANQNSWHTNLIDQSARLTCDITRRNGVARDKYHIVGHGQLQPNNRVDPGPNWPWATYLGKVQSHCGDGQPEDPPPPPPPPPDEPDVDPTADPPDDPPPDASDPAEIIVDSNQANNNAAIAKVTASANWTSTAATPGFYGSNYLFADTQPVSDAANFEFFLNGASARKIEIWYTAGANRSAQAPVVAFDAQGKNLGTVKVNEQVGGKAWTDVGTFNFTAGWNKIALSRYTTAGSVVIADAIRITGAGDDPEPPPMNGDPTHDELLALTQNCTQLPGTSKFKPDSGGSATIPICQLNGAIWWRADADIDCDGQEDPRCTVDPYFMPETSAKDSEGNFMNAAEVPFYVVPLPSNGFDPKAHGIKTGWSHYGSAGAILYNGKLIYAPYADAGPAGVIGELSYAAAEKLGIPSSPINGGVSSGVTYIVFTGASYIDPIEDPAVAASVGKSLAQTLLDNN